ncbi:NDP-hexose 2,3-dehydratase family protein [Streptomyces iconiensis]|uniref:NDP-hexose 2,3-dehydratase family protein n=1 Tax=Streptomyces iconiensis TaxID=1384038 RepID=A0ABT7A6D6_9ACTN|nr:NDP-hexose 2,3-dehydratase family protein [Streptomyces iconiensis]MDJ1136897.1 NDP-hexose 2,3-dehydratase family protein [Streptomyces iconiensis]
MTRAARPPAPERRHGEHDASRFTDSLLADEGAVVSVDDFRRQFAAYGREAKARVERIPFARLQDWAFSEDTGNLEHRSGRFFTVEGLRVRPEAEPEATWTQPIINQPEIGILGILAKEFDGVLHFLMQAKMEPGNANGFQLSPTVQATYSNYTRVHRGSPVKYLDAFLEPRKGRVLVDVLQSEHGAWFWCKRNRNIIVETTEDVPLHEGFFWLTLGQLQRLLALDNVLNMDSRTVLSCAPVTLTDRVDRPPAGGDPFRAALLRSLDPEAGTPLLAAEFLSWFVERKARTRVTRQRVALDDVDGWHRSQQVIDHTDGGHFGVIAVEVSGGNREVGGWTQPLFAPVGQGTVAFVVKSFGGVAHILVHARMEGGLLDVVELAPTVQEIPGDRLSARGQRNPFLGYVRDAGPERIHYEALLSEEGGRFHHAVSRYLVVDGDDLPAEVPDDYQWVTLGRLVGLLRHSHYLNVQARTLVACLHGLWSRAR